MMDLAHLIEISLHKELDVLQSDYAGYDKYTLRALPLYMRLARWQSLAGKIIRKPFLLAVNHFPKFWLSILKPPRLIYAKAMGLFADGFLDLYIAFGNSKYKEQAKECLTWLLDHPCPDYPLYSWGYPFDWLMATGALVPANTPVVTVSSICADPFWRWGEYFNSELHQEVLQSVCDSLLSSLYRHTDLPKEFAFYSYTPFDRSRVINANLLLAEKLFLAGKVFDKPEWIDEGCGILRYCLENVNKDGTFYYQTVEVVSAGHVQVADRIDSYHTGFVLRSLFRIYSLCPSDKLLSILKKGLAAYVKLFLGPKGETWFLPDKKVIDIHGCAESILCLGRMSQIFPQYQGLWERAIRWTIANMQDPESGHFYYQKQELIRGVFWTKRPHYIRWADAWMFKALAEALLLLKVGKLAW